MNYDNMKKLDCDLRIFDNVTTLQLMRYTHRVLPYAYISIADAQTIVHRELLKVNVDKGDADYNNLLVEDYSKLEHFLDFYGSLIAFAIPVGAAKILISKYLWERPSWDMKGDEEGLCGTFSWTS